MYNLQQRLIINILCHSTFFKTKQVFFFRFYVHQRNFNKEALPCYLKVILVKIKKKTSLQNKINHAKKQNLSNRGKRYLSQPIASEIYFQFLHVIYPCLHLIKTHSLMIIYRL